MSLTPQEEADLCKRFAADRAVLDGRIPQDHKDLEEFCRKAVEVIAILEKETDRARRVQDSEIASVHNLAAVLLQDLEEMQARVDTSRRDLTVFIRSLSDKEVA